jgi:hypothetical protein
MSHRQDLGFARLEGPEHIHPPDFDRLGVPWYVQTHRFRRTGGHWHSPRYSISLYEVTNDFNARRKLPVLRRVRWDHERDFSNVKHRGLFDPSVFEETIARMTRGDALEFDRLCQRLLDAVPHLKRKHDSVIPTSSPKTLNIQLATNEALSFCADGFEVHWPSERHVQVDKQFNAIWSYMDSICNDHKRQMNGWTDGYRKAPDADARAWAKGLGKP